MSRPSVFTLLLAIAIAHLLVATSPAANALQGMNLAPPHIAKRAEHVDLNQRMLRKRRPQDDIVPINVVDSPNTSTTAPATATNSASTPAGGNGNNGNGNSHTTTTTTAANIGQALSQLLNGGTTSSPTTTSQSSTTTIASTPSSTPVASQPTSTPTTTSTRKTGTVFVTESATDSAASSTDAASDPNNSFLPHSVIIALIVTGSCIAAGAAIWTIIRKWKFSPSRHFEDRLEPINWQPTQSSGIDHDPTMAALGRTGSRNGGRPGSMVSGDEHGSVRNMSSTNNEAISMAPDFPPAHDFTAGPASGLNPGYVDMHRGPSPAPTQYGAAAYGGQYETPNPYDAYDYNNNTGYGQQRRY